MTLNYIEIISFSTIKLVKKKPMAFCQQLKVKMKLVTEKQPDTEQQPQPLITTDNAALTVSIHHK